MTPKTKAEELVEKFRISKAITESYAKQSALIAVDEMMDVYVSACVAMGMSKEDAEKQESKYLQEVKQEIEAL